MDLLPFTEADVERSIPERFATVARTWPSRLAVAAGGRQLTYAELDRHSDGLAAVILRRTRDQRAAVAVLLADRVAAVVAMLATWKAGKLYVPLDPTFPVARLDTMLRDAEAGLIITAREEGAILDGLADRVPRQLHLDECDLLAPVEAPRVTVSAESGACLFYTSGSTGEPKGVIRSHGSMLHWARCGVRSLAIQPDDRVSALHSMTSIVSLLFALTALLSGAALLPFDIRRAGLRALADWIHRQEVSVLCAVVSTVRPLVAGLDPTERFGSVRIVKLGGEPLFRQDVERFRKHFRPGCLFVAGYGASEASGIAEYRLSDDTPLPGGRVPAGYPYEGVEILILADDGRPVDDGAGEVAVRSRYLAEGYWRRPDLTRATFLPDPVDAGTRIYRTGDVGRLRPDGCLELLGRKDEQVKIGGHRIHPGEIETALVEHPAVREVAVTASTQRGATHLVAYVVPEASAAADARVLRRFLHARLPVYMVPSTFVTLAALPLTASGKVDRAALSPPNPADSRRADFVPPRNPREHQIAAIWEELFGEGPIGANDDFFDLGGDSLLGAAFVAAIEEAWGCVVLPSVLLKASTVAELAVLLLGDAGGVEERVTALRVSGSQTPVFFVHNDYGRGLYTRGLARCLDPDRPFYAVHLHGLADRALPATVEAIAADSLRAVRAARSHGPYVLGGHCHGGVVALEMARQLQAAGEPVDVVVLIDTQPPGHHRRAASRSRSGRPVADILRRLRDYRGRLRILARSGPRAQLAFVRRQLAWAAYRRTIRHYVPSSYPGRVALLRAEEFPANSPDLGWSTLLPRLEVAVIPGDHHTCITRHVAALGARLGDVLRSPETER